jgi:integrase
VAETARQAHQRLAREGRICPFVFHHRGGQRIGSFRRAWARACREAGVPGRLLHDFRRTAVRNLVRAGVPEKLDSSGRDSATGKEEGKYGLHGPSG